MTACQRVRHGLDRIARDVDGPRIDDGQVVLVRHQRDEQMLLEEAQPHELRGQRAAVLLLRRQRERELLGGERTVPPQEFSEPGVHHPCGRPHGTLRGQGRRGKARPALRRANTMAASGARRSVQASNARAPWWRSIGAPSSTGRPARAAARRKGEGFGP